MSALSQAGIEVIADGLCMPESPRWHGELWFADFYDLRVRRIDASGHLHTVVEMPQEPGGLGFTADGSVLILSRRDRRLMKLAGGTLSLVADLSGWAGGKANDLLVDARGRAYAGFTGYDLHAGEKPCTAPLVRVDADGAVSLAAADVHFANGAVLNAAADRLILAETFQQRLIQFDVAEDGTLSRRRLFAGVPGHCPDGIAMDEEGAVWLADPERCELVRVFEGGRIDRVVSTGEYHATACAFGGADRGTLYLTLPAVLGPRSTETRAGVIGAWRVAVPGIGL
jgi:sugar lactone lactonase YvrE